MTNLTHKYKKRNCA